MVAVTTGPLKSSEQVYEKSEKNRDRVKHVGRDIIVLFSFSFLPFLSLLYGKTDSYNFTSSRRFSQANLSKPYYTLPQQTSVYERKPRTLKPIKLRWIQLEFVGFYMLTSNTV